MNARLSILAACAGVALGTTGCTAQSAAPTTTTPPAADPVKWAGAFCSGTTPVLTGAVELITLVAADAGNSPALKEGMLKILGNGSKSLADAEKKLKEVGAPGAEAPAVHDELVKLFGDGAKEYRSVAEQVQKIDADPKYKDAIAKAPECTEMRAKLGKVLGQ